MFVLAWLAGMGIMSWSAVKAKRPPWPGQLMVGSGYFLLLAMLAQYRPARSTAALMAWGVDLAALLQVLPGGPGKATGGPWPPSLKIPPTMLMPDGKSSGDASSCTDSSASASSGGGSASTTGTAPTSGQLNQQLTQLAGQFGWDSSQVSAWQYVLGRESGGNALAKNPQSGAFGAAQALGHGVAGGACPQTGVNQYGGFGLTTQQAQQANCGNLGVQLLWMARYMKATYGTPANAAAHERSQNWY